MTIGERIRAIRKKNGQNQRDFAKSIDISQPALAMLEKGQREVNNRHISLICIKHGVNEEWLRTGNGDMYSPISQDERYAINVGKLQRADDDTIIRWVNAIAETNPAVLKDIEEFLKKILDITPKSNP